MNQSNFFVKGKVKSSQYNYTDSGLPMLEIVVQNKFQTFDKDQKLIWSSQDVPFLLFGEKADRYNGFFLVNDYIRVEGEIRYKEGISKSGKAWSRIELKPYTLTKVIVPSKNKEKTQTNMQF